MWYQISDANQFRATKSEKQLGREHDTTLLEWILPSRHFCITITLTLFLHRLATGRQSSDWLVLLSDIPTEGVRHILIPRSWLDQAHNTGAITVLEAAGAIAAFLGSQVQRKVSILDSPQFWCYLDNDVGWCHVLEVENKNICLDEMNGKLKGLGIKIKNE